jgi:hypothetical protein
MAARQQAPGRIHADTACPRKSSEAPRFGGSGVAAPPKRSLVAPRSCPSSRRTPGHKRYRRSLGAPIGAWPNSRATSIARYDSTVRISNPQPFARLTRQRHRRHWARTSAWFEAALRAEVVRPVGEDPEDLTRDPEQCRAIVVSRVLRIAEAYSKARWFWYLRFLPDHCFGDPTRPVLSAGHERALCEAGDRYLRPREYTGP